MPGVLGGRWRLERWGAWLLFPLVWGVAQGMGACPCVGGRERGVAGGVGA